MFIIYIIAVPICNLTPLILGFLFRKIIIYREGLSSEGARSGLCGGGHLEWTRVFMRGDFSREVGGS